MLKAIIVDDEINSRVVLKELIGQFAEGLEIIGEANSVEKSFILIQQLKPDLIFLDVQMPTGNGFTLLEKFDPVPFDVIFVTSYDQYAINAIKFSALDYLLKPIAIDVLKDALAKAVRSHKNKITRHSQVINLLQSVDPKVVEKKIAFHHHDVVKLIQVSSILYIESDINYTHVTTLDGETYTSARTMKEFEEYLSTFNFFVRIHREVMINVHHIKQYNKGDPFIIEMRDGKNFEASRRKKVDVLERLKEK